jgi:hypothetical protein
VKARVLFYVLVLAMVFVIARASAAVPPIPPDVPTGDPPLDPVPVSTDLVVTQLENENAQLRARLARERRRFRHALYDVIHVPVYGTSWLERAFLCIHSGEGSWTDPNAPYWGGLQMDRSFMASYAPWALASFGTADNWPVSVQLATAIRAYKAGRGFGPWPNTARMCGLL